MPLSPRGCFNFRDKVGRNWELDWEESSHAESRKALAGRASVHAKHGGQRGLRTDWSGGDGREARSQAGTAARDRRDGVTREAEDWTDELR